MTIEYDPETDTDIDIGCPRCGGPLSYEIPDASVGHLGGTYCENVVSDAGRFCGWPGDMVDA